MFKIFFSLSKINIKKTLSFGSSTIFKSAFEEFKFKFSALSIKINLIDEEPKKITIVTKFEKVVALTSVMSNSFGFGGTNATLVFEKI